MYKNLKYNANGTIDMEIEDPKYGWIPFTASSTDTAQHGRILYQLAVSGQLGEIAPYAMSIDQHAAQKRASVQASFVSAEVLPVAIEITEGTFAFSGGYDSAQKLDAKRRLTQEAYAAGLVATDDVTFFDDADVVHTMSMTDATKVVIAVAGRYETDLYRKKQLLAAVDAIVKNEEMSEAEKITEIEKITW
jgi:hypothetical protein